MKKILWMFLIGAGLFAQEKNPDNILNAVKERFNKIKDYNVEATITVDVNFLKVPESHAKIYFKQPDKVKLESEGFALLPKEGLNFTPSKLLNTDYTAIYSRSDTLDNHYVDVIKIIPNNDTTDVILTTVWVDPRDNIFRKVETSTKKSGTFNIDLNYDGTTNVGLPSEIKLTFDVKGMQIPTAVRGEFENNSKPKRRKRNEPMTGMVTVKYDNYKVNTGLSDSFFEKDKSKKPDE